MVCADRAGFVVNALLFPYLNDAVRMLEASYSTADDIDAAMKLGCGYPMGPFELLDVVGLDVSLAIQRELYLELREPGFAPAPLLEHLVTAGYLGRRTAAASATTRYASTGPRRSRSVPWAGEPAPNRPSRSAAGGQPAAGRGAAVRRGVQTVQTHPDGDWLVRTVPGDRRRSRSYRCPGCDHEIRPGIGAPGGLAGRRAGRPGRPAALAHRLLAGPGPARAGHPTSARPSIRLIHG